MPTSHSGKIATESPSAPIGLNEDIAGSEHFLCLFQNSPEGVVLCDEDGFVRQANASFCNLFGYSPDETLGVHIDALVAYGDPRIREEAAGVNLLFREKGHFRIEGPRFRKDGSRVAVEIRGGTFPSSDRNYNFTIYRDISGHQETKRKLAHLLDLENLLLSASKRLVSSDNLDREVRDVLEKIGGFFGAHRSYLFLADEETGKMELSYEWCRPGFDGMTGRMESVSPRSRPWWYSRLESGLPVLVRDTGILPPEASREREAFEAQGIVSLLVLPVFMGDSLGGALGIDHLLSRHAWEDCHVKDLGLFAYLLGRVFHQDRMHRAMARDVARRMCLEEKARLDEERLALALEGSGDGLWDFNLAKGTIEVSRSALRFLGHDPATCTLSPAEWEDHIHPEDRDRVCAAMQAHLEGKSGIYQERYRRRGRSGDYIWVLARGKVVKRDDTGRPLRVAGLISDETERLTIEEVLEQSLTQMNCLLEGAIDVISRLVESRDPYTAGHQQRVSLLAGAVARRMGLSGDRVRGIQVAGLLHDIGKVCVPSDILNKPGELTSLEFALIREHPSRGGLILGQADFPWPVREIVEQHHERLDGSGYPTGLSGDGIRIEARIMAVADVVEAMISHRPYRPALGLDAALGEIRKGRGILYDSEVVDACETVFSEGFSFPEV